MTYASKLDEFEMFVSRAKYPTLSLLASSRPQSQKHHHHHQQQQQHVPHGGDDAAAAPSSSFPPPPRPKLLVIDDLPHVSDADARRRLSAALRDLVLTARGPVALVTTAEPSSSSSSNGGASGSSAASGSAKGLHKDILATLTAVGSIVVNFNPIIATSMSKVGRTPLDLDRR